MWRLTAVVACACACGGSGSAPQPMAPAPQPPQPITVEWKVVQGDVHQVDVALVVEGHSIAIGTLDAATADEAGTPNTCALRAASPQRTEIVCGEGNAYAAELGDGEIVISWITADARREVKRVPVYGDILSVKMLSLPLDEPATGP